MIHLPFALFGGAVKAVKDGLNELEMQDDAEIELVNSIANDPRTRLESYCYGKKLHEVLGTTVKVPETLADEFALTYEEYIVYLLHKYGAAQHNYFHNDVCVSKNEKIERLNEGLFCHHIAEECNMSLKEMTEPEFAREKPFDLYNANQFVYCNYLEHLLLHIKIAQEDVRVGNGNSGYIDMSGFRSVNRELNRYYVTGKVVLINKHAAELVKDQYEKYLEILRYVKSDELLSKYCDAEDLSVDTNGVVMQQIFNDLKNDEK